MLFCAVAPAELCEKRRLGMDAKKQIKLVVRGKFRGEFFVEENRAEVRLNPMESTLFRLFIAHPEGIASANLLSYWKELCRIYSQESIFDESSRQQDVLEALCSESKRCFYPVISRIKSKFVCALGSRKASGYYIKRYSDGLYRTKAVMVTHDSNL